MGGGEGIEDGKESEGVGVGEVGKREGNEEKGKKIKEEGERGGRRKEKGKKRKKDAVLLYLGKWILRKVNMNFGTRQVARTYIWVPKNATDVEWLCCQIDWYGCL
jgi:hypothetical protein